MSADAWNSCPVCHGLPEKLRGGYKQFYGKIPDEEYAKLKEEYEEKVNNEVVRIDYEYTLQKDLKIFLAFFAECTVCGAKWEHQGVIK